MAKFRVHRGTNDLFVVTYEDVVFAIRKLKHNKHDGVSLLSSDFSIYVHDMLYVHLAMLISALFSNGFVLDSLCVSTIIPIPKGKNNICESKNYRGIALSSILGKIIDLVLLHWLSDKLATYNSVSRRIILPMCAP